MERVYRIGTDKGQKISEKQLSTCIWAAMGIAVTIKDITVEEHGPDQARPTGEVSSETKQGTGQPASVPNGQPAKTDGSASPVDGQPKS